MTKAELRLLIIKELNAYHKVGVQYWREPAGPWDYAERILTGIEDYVSSLDSPPPAE